jgi:hypothetical protein
MGLKNRRFKHVIIQDQLWIALFNRIEVKALDD